MDPMTKWIDATLEIVRAGTVPEANDEQRHRAALACHSLLAILQPRVVAVQAPTTPEPGPDIFDVLLERLTPLAPTVSPGFTPRIIPSNSK